MPDAAVWFSVEPELVPDAAPGFQSNPSSHPVVILCDVDHASLRSLVDFMYHGEIEVPTSQLDRLLRLGELLQVQGISSHKVSSPRTAHAKREKL